MSRVVITHAVHDVDRWLAGKDERAVAIPGATNTVDLVALDGSKNAAVAFDTADADAFKAVLADLPPDLAAQAESHGVKLQTMTVFIEA